MSYFSPRHEALGSRFQLGDFFLPNRLVSMRATASTGAIAGRDTINQYSTPATPRLIISSAINTLPPPARDQASPGILTDGQVETWAQAAWDVQGNGGRLFCQLTHDATSSAAPASGIHQRLGSQLADSVAHQRKSISRSYAECASNAWDAGFDGIVIHARASCCAGGNSKRGLLEIMASVFAIWRSDLVAVRLTRCPTHLCALMEDLIANLFSCGLAFLHVADEFCVPTDAGPLARGDRGRIRSLYPGTLVLDGGPSLDTGNALLLAGHADLVAYDVRAHPLRRKVQTSRTAGPSAVVAQLHRRGWWAAGPTTPGRPANY
ncbi:oxidoreductase [Streptomyces sp. NBC_00322]|uniref:oxidoreductase n=1 Tax=Streptomyces sp. NBC_00322 TaxID=2975712 RepID=UPI003FA7C602